VLGEDKAHILRRTYGGEILYIARNDRQARARRDAEIIRRKKLGHSNSRIAAEVSITLRPSERLIRRVAAADRAQRALFTEDAT
jgi:Mor family transcriptional regulator